jgi:hypothetical protein
MRRPARPPDGIRTRTTRERAAVSGSTLYVRGLQPHRRAGAEGSRRSIRHRAVAAWDPNPNGAVDALVVSGAVVYAGGAHQYRRQPRGYVARSTPERMATPWNPAANYFVLALAVDGPTVYAGGWFTSIGGQTRSPHRRASTPRLGTHRDGTRMPTASCMRWPSPARSCTQRESSCHRRGSRNRIAALGAADGTATAEPHRERNRPRTAADAQRSTGGASLRSAGSRNAIAALGLSGGAIGAWNPNANVAVRTTERPALSSTRAASSRGSAACRSRGSPRSATTTPAQLASERARSARSGGSGGTRRPATWPGQRSPSHRPGRLAGRGEGLPMAPDGSGFRTHG